MAIEQHPIPQDVAGFKFRLIGEMTLVQFLWLAVGIIFALVIWSSPLPFFFKYPLAVIFASVGAGIAFVPIQGRPMDKWIIAFIKSVYSPTQFVWREIRHESLTTKQPVAQTQIASQAPTPNQTYIAKPAAAPALSRPLTSTTVAPVTTITEVPKPSLSPNQTPTKTTGQPIMVATPTPTRSEVTPSSPIQAKTEVRLPIPFTPTTPNTLVGMTLTPQGHILDGALVEIRQNGLSIRATRSNTLGQFLFSKPLDNGSYQLITDKPGFVFETYSLELRGQIVKPLKVQAQSSAT